jgi:putative endopeptidase
MTMKFIAACGASALAFAIAAPAFAADAKATAVATSGAAAATAAVPLPTMTFGKTGLDVVNIDKTIDPGDDFFAYANAKWLKANPLPPEFSRFGSFDLLREKSTSDVKALVDQLTAKDPASLTADERRIVDMYTSFDNSAAIEAAGLAPAGPIWSRCGASPASPRRWAAA